MCPETTNSCNTLTRCNAIESARTWVGTPFRHQGRGKSGIDCVGLVINVGKDIGAVPSEYDNKNYPRRSPHSEDFLSNFKENLIQKDIRDMKPGDVVVFKEPVFPCHCGILGWRYSELTVIHAYAAYKMVAEGFFYAENWDKKLVAVFEFKGIDEWRS